MCSPGAALLREEGVKVGGFPLTAGPVFHPADAGKRQTPAGVLAVNNNLSVRRTSEQD